MSDSEEEMKENPSSSSDTGSEMETDEKNNELSPKEIEATADKHKAEGNELYKQKDYKQALSSYTQAIELCPQCAAYYSNRSATYMMLEKYQLALEDARKSAQIDPTFTKAHMREAKCHLLMGEVAASIVSYQKVLQLQPDNTVATHELQKAHTLQQFVGKAFKCYEDGDFRQVVFCMNKCLEASPDCHKFKVLKAECLALLKRYQEAQELANDMLRFDSMNAEAIYVRGMCLYYQDNVDKAFQHFQHVLRLAPDHSKARNIYRKAKTLIHKKEEGNKAFRSGRYTEAHELYTEALAIDPDNVFTNSKLYCNRATVSVKLDQNDAAIQDCNKAVELNDGYIKAYMRRAKCYTSSEQYEEALRDYEQIFKIDKSPENKRAVQQAKLELKKSKRKDYYKILGISKSATEEEIKKAYKKRALIHHPDRHSGATEEKKKDEERLFKELGEAYAIMSDANKKARYDSGQDLDDQGGVGFQDFDPNQIFQTFFSGGGGMGGGGFPQQGGGMPGGFHFQFG